MRQRTNKRMEKKKPHYDLALIKASFDSPGHLSMTETARRTARALGYTDEAIVACVQGIAREHFYKSMTSDTNHAVWQDVYHVPTSAIVLYVKFIEVEARGMYLLSFKNREEE